MLGHGMGSSKCSLLVMRREEATGRQRDGELPDAIWQERAMGEILMYLQGEWVSDPLGDLCAALWIPAGHCSYLLCPTWSLSVSLASAAERCPNETQEVDHQVLIMPPPPHSTPSWVLLVLKLLPKH